MAGPPHLNRTDQLLQSPVFGARDYLEKGRSVRGVHGCERTISLIQRAWESQELSAMPRLRKWCFNAFLAVARLKLSIAVCQYLLQPGSAEHDALLKILPADIKYEWHEIR